jgi:hypothetical protein
MLHKSGMSYQIIVARSPLSINSEKLFKHATQLVAHAGAVQKDFMPYLVVLTLDTAAVFFDLKL